MAAQKIDSKAVVRNLVVVLGDQLSLKLEPFKTFDPKRDVVWMAESGQEAKRVWSHKQRIVLFLSAMRHFREFLRSEGFPVFYTESLEAGSESIGERLEKFLRGNSVERVVFTKPGEFGLEGDLTTCCERLEVPFRIYEDSSFFCTLDQFNHWANGRKQLRMEYFYREMRKENGILMDSDSPAGGDWNYDSSNRSSFGKKGPESIPALLRFTPDRVTKEVIEYVNTQYQDHPGETKAFGWPVTREEAKKALDDFISKGLLDFGKYQDAMWGGEPFLNHSLLAAAINLKLVLPSEVVGAVEKSFREGQIPIESAEGFIRQILGWREYVRGVYWRYMPDYLERNALDAREPLPEFYWTGKTSMNCVNQCVSQTLEFGYAHHIQRLMVTGLFGLLWGVDPKEMHQWYLAVYVDAVEWVELPNTMGMSQYSDGGVMASKPYVATGKYINRMSNYCQGCQYNPNSKEGNDACPFTVLYWDFLLKHEDLLSRNPRMGLQLRNAQRLDQGQKRKVRTKAKEVRKMLIEESIKK